jgi:hypothetical protein
MSSSGFHNETEDPIQFRAHIDKFASETPVFYPRIAFQESEGLQKTSGEDRDERHRNRYERCRTSN